MRVESVVQLLGKRKAGVGLRMSVACVLVNKPTCGPGRVICILVAIY